MAVKISGVLKDGAGKPVGGCAIELRAKKTSPTVVVEVISSSVTDANGHYSIEAEPGYYSVSLLREGFPPARAGEIYVTPTDAPDTLNAFLDAPKDGDLRPEVMKRFEEMVNTVIRLSEQVTQDKEVTEAASESAKNSAISASASEEESRKHKEQSQKSAEAAASSEENAKEYADSAERNAQQTAQDAEATTTARNDAERFAESAKQDAAATAEDRKATAEDVKQSGANAASSAQSAQEAGQHAADAEQIKNDIDATLAGTLKTANHLSEIAAEGEEAQQESRSNLGLKSAATMEPQRDIYDRTAGCLALPGAFGYGHLFSSSEIVHFSAKDGPAEFLQWVRETPPGRYLVAQHGGTNKKPIIDGPGTLNFYGYLDIDIQTDAKQENQQTKTKQVTFKGINGEIYTARIYGGINPSNLPKRWEKWLLNADDFARVLYSAANTYGDPDVGGLVLAAYTGASDDEKRIVINRRHMCEGSRLRQVVFEAEYRSSGFESAARALVGGRSLPGTYVSLSGTSDAPVFSYGVITLFVRIA